jgi:hypothetical protein
MVDVKAYLLTTATVFLLLTAAHVVRAFQETHLVRDPWFIIATLVPCALAIWAVRLLQRNARA